MRFDKAVIHQLSMPYAIGTFGAGPAPGIVCATEGHGPAVISDPPYRTARTLVDGPGGCMALLCDPEQAADLYAIMGCFAGYDFQGGAVYRVRPEGAAERVLDLPFAHRIGIARRGRSRYLIAAAIAAGKKDAADWSQPGALYAAEMGAAGALGELVPILPGIHKNHGFLLTRFEGHRSLLIGCEEGLFDLDLESTGSAWPARWVLSQEVSEIAVADLDGDGKDELVTIEPFHGSAVRAYRLEGEAWNPFWDAEVSFGHCVLAGSFAGTASVLVSNRSGGKDLLLFQFSPEAPARPERIVVEAGAGAATMLTLAVEGTDRIFSANQAAGEIVMYTPRG